MEFIFENLGSYLGILIHIGNIIQDDVLFNVITTFKMYYSPIWESLTKAMVDKISQNPIRIF